MQLMVESRSRAATQAQQSKVLTRMHSGFNCIHRIRGTSAGRPRYHPIAQRPHNQMPARHQGDFTPRAAGTG